MKPKTRIWVTADPHFYHAKVIKYSKRPYKNLSSMHRDLVERWNNTVDVNDMVIILGDFVWDTSHNRIFNITKRLKGRKILVLGNHDAGTISKYLNDGFDFVCNSFRLDWCSKKLFFVHDPNKVPKKDHQSYDIILHGHTHLNPFPKNNGRFINVCVEQTNYKPILLNSIIHKTQKHLTRKRNKRIERELELEYRDGISPEDEIMIEESRKSLDQFRNRGR